MIAPCVNHYLDLMWDIEYRFGGNNGMDLLEKLIGDKGRILQLLQ